MSLIKMPSTIFIFGDYYLSKNNIIAIKKKYTKARWVTMDASNDNLNNIRLEAGSSGWMEKDKIILIENIPNRKQVREFIIDLCKTSPESTKIIVWDSTNKIKVDPKTQTLNKTWGDFVKSFREIDGAKVINNGEQLTEKSSGNSLSFVKKCFAKYNLEISDSNAKLMIGIVGHNRGLLSSDVDKMAVTAKNPITEDFILENAFPTAKESALLNVSKTLNNGTYENAVFCIERFVESGFNPNELAVVILRQARWQMVGAYYWATGMSWSDISNNIVNMGKFPALIWHNPKVDYAIKKKNSETYQTPEGMIKYLINKQGIPKLYFKVKGKNNDKKNRPESIPHPIVAKETVKFLENKIVKNNNFEGVKQSQIRTALLNRCINIYVFMLDKLATIRFGDNPMQDLQEMTRVITNTRLDINLR